MWYGRSKILIIHQFSGVWGPISNCHQIILCIISCNQKMLVWFFIAFWISNNKWGMMKLKCCQFIQFLRGVGTNLIKSPTLPPIILLFLGIEMCLKGQWWVWYSECKVLIIHKYLGFNLMKFPQSTHIHAFFYKH